jgi:hypothetical protein
MQFVTKTNSIIDLHVMYKNNEIANIWSTKVLRLTLDSTFFFFFGRIISYTTAPKLSSAHFAVRAVKIFLSQESLKIIYFPCFHSILTHELVFWGNSYHSNTVFKLQKRILELCWGLQRERESCTEYFRKIKILPLQSQYIHIYTHTYLLLLFVINSRQCFKVNTDIQVHNINEE